MKHTLSGVGHRWRATTACLAILASVVCARHLLGQGKAPTSVTTAASRVRAGLLVRPDTVQVGDHFELTVKVVVPVDARIEWPTIEDTAALVVMRTPVRISATEEQDSRTETATYALAAWDVGSLSIGLPDAIVRFGGTMTHVPLASARIVVNTVLPRDTTLHKPKPAKDLFPRAVPWWERWWPALLVLAALALLWWLYRRRRTVVARGAVQTIDVYARALQDFDRLDRLALADAGEGGRCAALAVEIVRAYLAARVPAALLSHTSVEVLRITANDARVPQASLAALFVDGDAIKFGRQPVGAVDARGLVTQARAIVDAIESAETARRAAEHAERQARELAQAQDAEAADNAARRGKRRATSGAA